MSNQMSEFSGNLSIREHRGELCRNPVFRPRGREMRFEQRRWREKKERGIQKRRGIQKTVDQGANCFQVRRDAETAATRSPRGSSPRIHRDRDPERERESPRARDRARDRGRGRTTDVRASNLLFACKTPPAGCEGNLGPSPSLSIVASRDPRTSAGRDVPVARALGRGSTTALKTLLAIFFSRTAPKNNRD